MLIDNLKIAWPVIAVAIGMAFVFFIGLWLTDNIKRYQRHRRRRARKAAELVQTPQKSSSAQQERLHRTHRRIKRKEVGTCQKNQSRSQ